mgnify:CR=1 FL=1
MDGFFDQGVVLVIHNDGVHLLKSNISTVFLQLFLDVLFVNIGHRLEHFNVIMPCTTLEVIMMLCVAFEAETYFPKTSFTLKHSSFDRIHSTTFTFEANMFYLVFEVLFVFRESSKTFTINFIVDHFL